MNKDLVYVDPVCGMKIKPSDYDDNMHSAEYNGTTYYFCSPFCTAAFLENPEQYAKKNNNKLPESGGSDTNNE